jgi:hypothetical protein
VLAKARNGFRTTLVLDANICLNLSGYSRGTLLPHVEAQVSAFLLSIEISKVDVVPMLGCMELASTREQLALDTHKLSSILSNVKRALDLDESSIVDGLPRKNDSLFNEAITRDSIEYLYPMLRYTYSCFLKIIEIRHRGHLKDRAIKNYVEFYDWCERMNCHVPLIEQAALALFGGAEPAQKLIRTNKEKTPLDAAWGASWDVLYSWLVQNYLPTIQIDGMFQHCIFATHDEAAAYVAGHCIPQATFLNKGEPYLSASEVSFEFPYYENKMDRLDAALKERKYQTFLRISGNGANEPVFDRQRVEAEIASLETIVMGA